MPGPRASVQLASRRRMMRRNIRIPDEFDEALCRLSESTRRVVSHVMVDAIEEYLRGRGMLPPIKKAEDFAEGEDAFLFPWSTEGARTRYSPKAMVWWSKDPDKRTWATLFASMEGETMRRMDDIIADYPIQLTYALKIWRRFDLWRRGEQVRPGYDPLAVIRRPQQRRKK